MDGVVRALLLPAVALLLAVLPGAVGAQAPQTVPITVVVTGLRNDRGHVRVGLYASPNTWPSDGGSIARCVAPVHGGVARCVLTAPRAGRYAFALLHDENDNGRMDKDAFGLPQEGYGFSNDVGPSIAGAPSFASASFVASAPTELRVRARYGI